MENGRSSSLNGHHGKMGRLQQPEESLLAAQGAVGNWCFFQLCMIYCSCTYRDTVYQ